MKGEPRIPQGTFSCARVTTQHPLDFVLWQGVRSAESVAYGLYVRIRASQQRRLEGKRRGVLSSYAQERVPWGIRGSLLTCLVPALLG